MARGDFTKAKQISMETKRKVWERQKGRSILSYLPISIEECCCHFVGRGVSGVGYEWNIIGLTQEEHRLLDENKPIKVNGRDRYTNKEAQTLIRNHLILNYDGWALEKCKYHKYWEEKDYGIVARTTVKK